ncbi:hypothetical protein GCM10022268_24040 [Sphingomonas cynarae]|uniref:Tyr recombinase domain-containing protein n=1 Tax=Sphingomonas cynarae TaxID=930197 RepID=A0ABP7E7P7_9SPHN
MDRFAIGGIAVRQVPSAFRNKRVREVHALPLGWRHLTQVDIHQIKALIRQQAAPGADLRSLECCLLLWSSLTTGRQPADLVKLTLRLAPKGERLADQLPGLIRRRGLWGWWLTAAAPSDQRRDKAHVLPQAACLYLPATQTIARLVERCIAARRTLSSGRDHMSGARQPLFTIGPALIGDVTALLASRHPVTGDRARRATTTPEALARWLPAELTGAPGGDIVPASIITGSIPTIGRSQSHYGAVPHRTLVDRYRGAIEAVDALSHYDVPGEALSSHLGDKFTPTDIAVAGLIRRLTEGLNDPDADAAERHLAMMRYTVALLSFALAHRGDAGTMPSKAQVHGETRLCWIRDKVIRGKSSRRMVWVCDTAFDQLQRYDHHLDLLQTIVSPPAASAIKALRCGRNVALFDMRDGRVEHWSVADAVKDTMRQGGLDKNAGRHWLRSKLVGRCSTETLHAFYGHGPVEDGSWDSGSALDPAAYRADLGRVLDPVLNAIDWIPRSVGEQVPVA